MGARLSGSSSAGSRKAGVGMSNPGGRGIGEEYALRVSGLGVRLPKGRGISRLWGEHHWALRGIDFDLRRGEAIGILGRNGSGKSTLLRAIAGIIAIDEGTVSMAPDLTAAILSPGAGFESKLTGRENLINSALYQGFLPRVVKEKLDDIVELSGIGEWIDQPVAIYSAGMRARLGLSLALHLPSDILMIDETLSAGDAAFRAKAKQVIDTLIASDRTVLLVSHNLETLRTMCTRGLVLDRGRQITVCDIDEAIKISKSILLSAAASSEEPGISRRASIEAQIEALQAQLVDWRAENAERAKAARLASHGYLAALERVVAIADKLVIAPGNETDTVAGFGPGRSGGTAVMEAAAGTAATVKAYNEAYEKMQSRKVEREAAIAEQQRAARTGEDLQARLDALRGQLAEL